MDNNDKKNRWFLNSEVDFDFFIDLNDGTAIDAELFEALGRPLLSQSFAPSRGDIYTIPIPDTHMTIAMAKELTPNNVLQAFKHSDMSSHYKVSKSAWIGKLNSVVYRGQDLETRYFLNGGKVLYPRRRLVESICVLANKKNDQDICQAYNIHLSGAKTKCSNCSLAKLSSRHTSSSWRYQVNVDGHGQSYDGSIWKLLSNSTVIWVITDAQPHHNMSVQQTAFSQNTDPMFQAWYSSYIKPNCHYITAPPEKVTDAYLWCQCHPRECERMAMAAADTVHKVVQPAVVKEYFKQLLTYLQNWQRDTILELLNKEKA